MREAWDTQRSGTGSIGIHGMIRMVMVMDAVDSFSSFPGLHCRTCHLAGINKVKKKTHLLP